MIAFGFFEGMPYEDCEEKFENYRRIKNSISKEQVIEHIEQICSDYLKTIPEGHNEEIEALLKEVQYDIMKLAVAMELMEEEYYD